MSGITARTAKDRALGLLAVRWRSRAELRGRLVRAGFDRDEVESALGELQEAGLIDDRRFAAELTRARTRRLSGSRAIRSELRQKGVGQDVAEEVLAQVEDEEESRAFQLAASRAERLGSVGPEAAYRRLVGLLTRRGYAPGLAREAARQAMSGLHPTTDVDQARASEDSP
ncbi:MAG TPA: regulatory protein RecX [Actinomycetota bacterium]